MAKSKFPMGIKRFITHGELDGEDPNTTSLLDSCGNLLDHNQTWDILGDVVFEGEDGKFYEVTVEACINEISKERAEEVANILGGAGVPVGE